jgi:hypothetical protein
MICIVILILFILFLLFIIYRNIFKNKLLNNELFNNNDLVNNNKKIAFLFLIYDEINHEEIWKLFFNSIDINKYNIYIHYKYY